jgi:16S rRNA (cytosine1402-N4)-methyltransferase
MTVHKPVLVEEVLHYLDPQKNKNFIDCTVGGGGHAEKILEQTGPKGKLLGFDWDKEAIERTRVRLERFHSRLILINESYIKIKKTVYDKKFNSIDGIVFDLGLSSDQLQDSGRGFSFQVNEPLDMRFSPDDNDLTASEIINTWDEKRIADLLYNYAEETNSRKIAKAIVEERKNGPIDTTLRLVQVVLSASPKKRTKIHPATKTFQALRMEVNNELSNIRLVLKDCMEILEKGAKLAVITFHSIEDRTVKEFFQYEAKDCHCPPQIPVCRCGHKAQIKIINKKPIIPSDQEITENFRSRSAKLRVIEKK